MKIVYIPLDERPCNYEYPLNMVQQVPQVICKTLPKEMLGYKKNAADTTESWAFIKKEVKDTNYLILSTEMVVYGGLLPSRIHELTPESKTTYMEKMRQLKIDQPQLKIFVSNLIMRTPRYNSNDEEPDYYGKFGERIFRYGWLKDQKNRGVVSEKEELQRLENEIPQEVIKDYENRRAFNVAINLANIELVEEGVIDFLAIPQDDSAPYGYTAMDQAQVYGQIERKNLKEKIMVYPGADEVGFTLLARAYNEYKKRVPKVYVNYASTLGPTIVPMYEDRIINESLKAHVIACGMALTQNRTEADYYLAYNTPGKVMQESWDQRNQKDITYDTYRHLLTFIQQISQALAEDMKVGICDSAFANGGDLELIAMLDKQKILKKVSVYKGWNTNCNSLGSTLASLCFVDETANIEKIRNNLLSNLFEDVFYQSIIRMNLTESMLGTIGTDYFDLKDQSQKVIEEVRQEMLTLSKRYLTHTIATDALIFTKLASPWNRMFEINCQVELKGE